MTELFDTIGHKAEQVAPNTNGANGGQPEEDERVVEEIESLCMNCHENVSVETLARKAQQRRLIMF